MSIRASQIYIRNENKHKLLTIAKALNVTADELADRLIGEGLAREYPEVEGHFVAIRLIEDQIVQALATPGSKPGDQPLLQRLVPEQQRESPITGEWGQGQ